MSNDNNDNDGPLAISLMTALDAERIAELAWCDDDSADKTAALLAAHAVVVDARKVLIGSDEDIEWEVDEDGNGYTTVWAASAREALKIATTDYDASCYGDVEETFRITIRVSNDLIDEADSGTVTINPPEPDCVDKRDHDWWSPYAVVGGCESNPGVWGSGHGQVRIKCVCSYCGAYQVVDYGAIDSSNGTQLTTTSYGDADNDSLGWIADNKANKA